MPIGTWVSHTLGWRWAFHTINVLTVILLIAMSAVLPKHHYQPQSRFLAQFFIFSEKRIWSGIFAVIFAAAATYVFYTYLTPILEDELDIPDQYVSLALAAFGLACLASNLYGGKLGNRGRGVESMVRGKPIYLVQFIFMLALPLATLNTAAGCLVLLILGFLMYLQNTPSQVLFMDVTAESHSGSLNLASSFNSMSFNIGIALGSAVGGLVTDDFGIRWLGPFGAVFALLAFIDVTWLAIEQRHRDIQRSNPAQVSFINE